MKKAITFILAAIISVSAFAQPAPQSLPKKDTTIQITVSLDQYRALMYAIDQNIDSKKTSKEILEFIAKSAKILEADKPKEIPAKEKPKQ